MPNPAGVFAETSMDEPVNRTHEEEGIDRSRSLVIVGIGASAGGLPALEQLLSHVPADSGLAYVVVQHLAPEHASVLAQILGRQTRMPVVEVTHGASPKADHVYVITPGTELSISGGAFQVEPMGGERRGVIDGFLRSLAEDRAERALGVLLSGSGRDGTEGLRAIRERGGFTIAQAPESAGCETMPRSAIDAGVVDEVLLVDEMPARLIAHARHGVGRRGPVATPPAGAAPEGEPIPSDEELVASLERVNEILRNATSHDFSHYKRGTVLRRLRRRLLLRRPPSLHAYVDFLARDENEPQLLAKDLLIGVTQFFREPEALEFVGQRVLPRILASKPPDEAVRIWVAGCASGEEAYSLGILVRELLPGAGLAPVVQIFATDIDAEAITEARQARYPAEIAEHVSPERLERFFTRDGSGYQVAKEVREMCVFSEHSLIRDPPFLGLDLISCRNVLIYLEAALQRKLMPVFHYALHRGGHLFLGPSEGLAGHSALFETVEKRFRVFRRAEPGARPVVEFPLAARAAPRAAAPVPRAPAAPPTPEQTVAAVFERLVLQEYAPPGAVVNALGEVLCVVGPTGRYLQPPAGVLTTNILDIAHASLRIALRTGLHAAAHSGKRVVRDDVHVEVDGSPRWLRVTVRPMHGLDHDNLFAVVFEERAAALDAEGAAPGEPASPGAEGVSAIEQLESELRTTRASLRTTIEELETANQALTSSNEELLSTNEEMQSANEELQSSQEELKTLNDELARVNAELGRKVDELGRANSDLSNLFASTDIATLFLDREQRVARFTPAAKAIFRLIDADVGRPFSDLAPRLAGEDLAADVRLVLETARPIEQQVQTLDGRVWYLLRVLPYRTGSDVIAGTVVTLADLTQLKRGEVERERLAEERRAALEQLSGNLDAMHRLFKIGSLFLQEGNLLRVLDEILDTAIAVSGADFGNIQLLNRASGDLEIAVQRGFPASWLRFWAEVQRDRGACGTALELNERVIVEDVETSPIFADTPALVVQRAAGVRAVQSTPILGRSGEPLGMLSTHYRTPGRPSDQALQRLDLVARQTGDILERARAEEALHESESRFRLFVDSVTDYAIYTLDPDGRVTSWNVGAERIKGYTAKEILGEHFSRFYTEEDRKAGLPGRALEAAERDGRYEVEGWRVRKDGSRFRADAVVTRVLDRDGRLAGFSKVTRDVSQRVAQQEALDKAREALAQSQKMEALGQLSGGVAHDFNNILHVIGNAVDALRRSAGAGDPNVVRLLDLARRNTDRAAALTKRILAFSRKQPLDPRPIAPNKLVVGIAELLRQTLAESVAIETVIAGGVWSISADPNQLETAILNLAVNARDAMPQGGKLTIETANAFLDEANLPSHEDVKPGQYVMIAISDTGTGMSKEDMARAFEPFFTTKETGHGTGLGLSQVYGFIKQSGGHVKIYSELGEGTTVKLYLPRLADGEVAEVVKDTRPLPSRSAGETILVVEDEEDVRAFTAEGLRELGYRVLTASDAKSALEVLETEPQVDLLFTDLGLPGGMNGQQLAGAAQERWPGLQVLFTTAYVRNALVHHGRLDPSVELIVKPFTQADLMRKIRGVLDARVGPAHPEEHGQ